MATGKDRLSDGWKCLRLSEWDSNTVSIESSVRLIEYWRLVLDQSPPRGAEISGALRKAVVTFIESVSHGRFYVGY
jgi:hypothetical protein